MQHFNITIKGRVQGVGFRYSALKAAQAFGIRGFVRNNPDGSVYIEAESPQPGLDLFLEWCRKGPGLARIDAVTHVESGIRGFEDFRILH
jgi:acylphosphatase